MKSYRLFFYVSLILSAFFLISCDDEPLDIGLEDGLPNVDMGSITFKVDGEFKEYVGAASYRDHVVEFEEEVIEVHGWQIMGTDPDQSGASLAIQLFPADLETGRYELADIGFRDIYVMNYIDAIDMEAGDSDIYISLSGYVDITEVDLEAETMSGTFEGTLELSRMGDEETVTIEITEGRLNEIYLTVIDDSSFE